MRKIKAYCDDCGSYISTSTQEPRRYRKRRVGTRRGKRIPYKDHIARMLRCEGIDLCVDCKKKHSKTLQALANTYRKADKAEKERWDQFYDGVNEFLKELEAQPK